MHACMHTYMHACMLVVHIHLCFSNKLQGNAYYKHVHHVFTSMCVK